jgi:2Fe-2S ferredoxin
MPRISFVDVDESRTDVIAEAGKSIMNAAVNNGIEAIVAECGGACACATCHCYVADEWLGKVPPPASLERGMLESVVARTSRSRLSCQIRMADELDGIVIHLPESQY